ncbi:MAG: haloalkane dehalogenase [Gammaproteobacteria bacterium]|nr:haloalkane dehalogenase [Gammaproteobacteria bacterium]
MQAAVIAGGVATLPLAVGSKTAQAQGSSWAAQKKKARVRGLEMAYYETGTGDPIVFLHGNPTSSYLWRNIIPHVQHLGRCIAPDLVGMGDSDPLPNGGPGAYKFSVHRDYIFELLETIGVTERVTLVIHDWGSGIGLSYAQRYTDRVRGIAYMEAILTPSALPVIPEPSQGPFAIFRSPQGEEAVLQKNVFVEQILIGGLGYYLSDADKAEYRRPYLQAGESRRPTLTWPRELPRGGNPSDTAQLVTSYSDWFADSQLPKLFIRVNPGAILRSGPLLDFVRGFDNQQEVTVFGSHFVQEISPDAIGRALVEWMGSEAV